MPNTPAQLPNIDLPGAEYFSLAPHASVALQGRRRVLLLGPTTSVPASSNALSQATIQLEAPFPQNSGIYIHRVWVMLFPQDASGKLTISSGVLALNVAAIGNNALAYPIGISVVTSITPIGGTVATLDRDILATWRDIAPMTGFAPAPMPGVLNLVSSFVFVNSDGAAAHSIQCLAGIVYTRLDGLTE